MMQVLTGNNRQFNRGVSSCWFVLSAGVLTSVLNRDLFYKQKTVLCNAQSVRVFADVDTTWHSADTRDAPSMVTFILIYHGYHIAQQNDVISISDGEDELSRLQEGAIFASCEGNEREIMKIYWNKKKNNNNNR